MSAASTAVAIFSKPGHRAAAEQAAVLAAWLRERGFQPHLDPDAAAAVQPWRLAVVLGGDGTMLRVARMFASGATPILAVNQGTLGFLAETSAADMFPAVTAILEGRGHFRRLPLLQAEVRRAGERIAHCAALNEIGVNKSAPARIVSLRLAIDEQRVATYRADGILVSTPTGSTAYSLSAGGPVLHPGVAAVVVTPICPHSLNLRPLIVPASATVRITLDGHAHAAVLTYDGQEGALLQQHDEVVVCPSDLTATLASAADRPFFDLLRTKLKWG